MQVDVKRGRAAPANVRLQLQPLRPQRLRRPVHPAHGAAALAGVVV